MDFQVVSWLLMLAGTSWLLCVSASVLYYPHELREDYPHVKHPIRLVVPPKNYWYQKYQLFLAQLKLRIETTTDLKRIQGLKQEESTVGKPESTPSTPHYKMSVDFKPTQDVCSEMENIFVADDKSHLIGVLDTSHKIYSTRSS